MSETRPARQAPPMPAEPNFWFAVIRQTKASVAEAVRAGMTIGEIRTHLHDRVCHRMPDLAMLLIDRAVAEQICQTTSELEAEGLVDA